MITEDQLRRFYDMAEDLFKTAQRFRKSTASSDDMRLVGCLNRYEFLRNEIVWPWTPKGPGEPYDHAAMIAAQDSETDE